MNCNREQIQFYYDRALPDAERAEVGAHLDACAECAAELARLSALGEFLRTGAPELPTAQSLSPLFARVRAGRMARLHEPRVIRLAKWLTSAAAAIMLGCGGALWFSSGSGHKVSAQAGPAWTAWAVSNSDEQVALIEASDPLAPVVEDVRNFGRD